MVRSEDKAWHEIAVGFWLGLPFQLQRQLQVLPQSGGWPRVLEHLLTEDGAALQKYPDRHIVALMDCDGDAGRIGVVRNKLKGTGAGRIYVVGALDEAEDLRRELGMDNEAIGRRLAKDCETGEDSPIWNTPQLSHNGTEIDRLREAIRPMLFPAR